jgi:hypothetical protein
LNLVLIDRMDSKVVVVVVVVTWLSMTWTLGGDTVVA